VNEPYRTAFDTFEKQGDFRAALAHCLAFGEVQSNADFFCMGWPEEGGVFFVQMLAGDFRKCARFNAGRFTSLKFARDFKGSPRARNFNLQRLNHYGKRINTAAAAE
jgi:hypothetical protein